MGMIAATKRHAVLDVPLTSAGVLAGVAAFAVLEIVLSVPMWVGVSPYARQQPQARRRLLQRTHPLVPSLHGRRRRRLLARAPAWFMAAVLPPLPACPAEGVGASQLLRRPQPHHLAAADHGSPDLRPDLADRDQWGGAPRPLAVPQPERVRGRSGRELPILLAPAVPPHHSDLPLRVAGHLRRTLYWMGLGPHRPPRSTTARLLDPRQGRRTETSASRAHKEVILPPRPGSGPAATVGLVSSEGRPFQPRREQLRPYREVDGTVTER
jgi:hypothetical protein